METKVGISYTSGVKVLLRRHWAPTIQNKDGGKLSIYNKNHNPKKQRNSLTTTVSSPCTQGALKNTRTSRGGLKHLSGTKKNKKTYAAD